jgi:1-acyl-sn-glycerol-3-phosphate acyltransferase
VIESSQNAENNNPPRGGNRFTGWLGDTLLRLSGWSFKGELPQHPKMVIAVAPHTSNWDFVLGVAVLFALRIRIRFLGKHSLFVPVAKQLLEAIGGIPVDRRSSHGVVEQAVDHFKQEAKMILAIAPEGTRSLIYPWKTGFVAIAHKAKVPIVLIGFDFKHKQVVFGPDFLSSGDFAQDMQKVYGFYATIPAKYPDKVAIEP